MSKEEEEEDILMCEKYIKENHNAPIVRHYGGFIILAQNELDFKNKKNAIIIGDNLGFYKLDKLLTILKNK